MGHHFGLDWRGQSDNPSLGDFLSAFPRAVVFRLHLLHRLQSQLRRVQSDGAGSLWPTKYVKAIYDHLIDLKPDGTFRLNIDYFNYCTGLTMTNGKFDSLFDGPPRKPESPLTQREMDLARSVQDVTEEVMLRLARTLHRETGQPNLCLAGGVALNCVGNGRILREGPFEGFGSSRQPAMPAGPWARHYQPGMAIKNKLEPCSEGDAMHGAFLGPFSNEEIEVFLRKIDAPYERFSDEVLFKRVAEELAGEKVVGWFQGRMEFGPRALGGRSIIGDARSPKMQSVMNLKIKYRESFRPFAPSVLRERVADYFELNVDSPYMLLVAPVVEQRRTAMTGEQQALWGIDLLNVPRSDIPAITHVDYSARIQTVHKETNPRYYRLLKALKRRPAAGSLLTHLSTCEANPSSVRPRMPIAVL